MRGELMDKRLMREFRERYQAVADTEIREQQAATVAERWQQLNSLWRMAVGLGLPLTHNHDDDEAVYLRWAKLKGM
jgi:hypothetical protein